MQINKSVALRQHEQLQGEVLAEHLAYWKQQLGGMLEGLELPIDWPRPTIPSSRGATYHILLPKGLTESLKELSLREGVTLYILLVAAFQTLLHRYSGQDDIVLGTTSTGRTQVETKEFMGVFLNTLALRSDLSGNPTFREMLRRVRGVVLEAQKHQDMPFELLVKELQPEQQVGQNSLFQVMLTFDLPQSVLPEEWTLIQMEVETGTSQLDLTLGLDDRSEGLWAHFEYRTDLFEEATIVRMAGHWQTLLESIVTDPTQHLAELPLLTEKERHELLVEWNSTQAAYPQDKCVHQLFEEQVERTPEAMAVVFEDDRLTYLELNRRANQLAHYLLQLGVGPDVLVGICVERSLDMVVGLLGVLKAGGAYVPLDPASPKERLAFQLEDSQALVLLTHEHLLPLFPQHQAHTICLDSARLEIAQELMENLVSSATSENLAYMIYTSGSTGRPKGVLVTHQNLVNSTVARMIYYKEPVNSYLLLLSFAFDASVGAIFWTLLGGGVLVLPRADLQLEISYLEEIITQNQVSHLACLPAFYMLLLKQAKRRKIVTLRTVIVGGDVCPVELVEYHHQLLSQAELFNEYGPTEASIWCSVYNCQIKNMHSSIPIGRPIANMQIFLLDTHMQLVPVGVPGEIYIGGIGVSQGYLNHPKLTAERFISHPFSNQPDARLYKTGDLACYLPDGNIEFLGRLDHQVKLHGFRIDLDGIASVLNEHPAVQETVVVMHEHTSGDQQLVAYVVPGQKSLSVESNHRKLSSSNQDVLKLDAVVEDAVSSNGEQSGHPTGYLLSEQILRWQMVFDETYQKSLHTREETFNTIGWNSSYTGLPFPEKEMHEWVNNTVERVLALRPNNVLEIGCGSGLLLFPIAPHCSHYYGTDISQVALQRLEETLTRHGQTNVTLQHRLAEDFAVWETGMFDTIIINSVAQYFPNIDYFVHVLEESLRVVKPGGTIFVGDVRNLQLLEAFHTSVQIQQSTSSRTRDEVIRRVKTQIAQEQELLIDPRFFNDFQRHHPQCSYVELQLKRGLYHNEMTRFRYDALLYVNHNFEPKEELLRFDWGGKGLNLEAVHAILEDKPEIVVITRIPNARLQAEKIMTEWLATQDPPETVGGLREILRNRTSKAIDPEDFWDLGQSKSYTVEISSSASGELDGYDVVFRRSGSVESKRYKRSTSLSGMNVDLANWYSYANNPAQARFIHDLVPELRDILKVRLPEYMLPASYVLLETMPLTLNGKVDYTMLPAPDAKNTSQDRIISPPSTPIEEQVVAIMSGLLGLEEVGVDENFFMLGGHSLLGTQVILQITEAFGVDIPLRKLSEAPTARQLSVEIEQLMIEQLETMSDDDIRHLLEDREQIEHKELN